MFLLTLSTPVRKRFDLFTTLLKTKIHRYTYTFQYSPRYSTFIQVAAKKTLYHLYEDNIWGSFIQGYLKQVYTINHKIQVQGIADTTACLVIMIILPKLCQLKCCFQA